MNKQYGLSLVELMITITLGLLLMAALTAVFSNTLGVNSRSLKLSQLNEEATVVMDLMVGDLRRAGYRADAAELIYDPANASTAFNDTVKVFSNPDGLANSCIVFSYDENSDGEYQSANEDFGYRLFGGVLQRRRASNSCDAGGWEGLTKLDLLQVTELEFILTEQMINLVNEQRVTITMTVALPSDPEITRTMVSEVVIRNAF
ncbi:PilW family protein [Pseudidiomarina halophila]|uniref:PilW family protein n=1 Tax=Pseudidiomarina halophila TaxID=1449799 RepID=UPI00361C1F68